MGAGSGVPWHRLREYRMFCADRQNIAPIGYSISRSVQKREQSLPRDFHRGLIEMKQSCVDSEQGQ